MYSVPQHQSACSTDAAIAKSRQVFGELGEAVVLSDINRRIVWVNRAFSELMGYDLGDIAGQKTHVLYDQTDDYTGNDATEYNRASTPVKAGYVVQYRHKSGRMIRSETIGWAVRDEAGQVIGYAALIRDMDDVLNLHEALARLYDISSSQALSGREKIHAILRTGCEYFRLPTAQVGVIGGGKYTVLYAISTILDVPPGTQFELSDVFCSETMEAEAPMVIADARSEGFQDHPHYLRSAERSYIGIPLTVDGECMGTLSFGSPVARARFSVEEQDLIKLFAAWIAQEIGMTRAYEELSRVASTDWLTRAAARRHFHPDTERAFTEFEASGRSASLIMVDIDHFKRVNDTYGHGAGDDVLHQVADALRDQIPAGAKLYRIGGEEFAVLIRDTAPKDVLSIAEQMRWAVDALDIEHPRGAFSVSASLGAATLNEHMMDTKAWLYQADAALYASKNRGRNRVSCAGMNDVLDLFESSRATSAVRRAS